MSSFHSRSFHFRSFHFAGFSIGGGSDDAGMRPVTLRLGLGLGIYLPYIQKGSP